MEEHKKAQDHLEAAKEEIKNAAGVIVKDTKEKAHEILEAVTGTIAEKAEKVHTEVKKPD